MIYKIIMKKNDFFKIHNRIAVKNLEISDEEVHFEVELGSLNILKETGYPYHLVDSIRIQIEQFFKKYYMGMIGLLFLFSLVYINTFRVTTVEFNTSTPINDGIETEIRSSFKRLFCFDFTNLDYTSLSKKLRLEYIEYPYIEVYAKNNKVQVDIFSYDEGTTISSQDETPGDVIAKKDGVIESYYVYSGENCMQKNKYVHEGEVLIRGNINQTQVSSKGLILAHTYEKVNIEIQKKESVEVETSQKQTYYHLSFFHANLPISKNASYVKYDSVVHPVFNLFDIFSVKKIEEHEKNVIIKENTLDDAITQAEDKIRTSFEEEKTNDLEQIEDMKQYKVIEDEDSYQIVFILKKLESIGQFIAY